MIWRISSAATDITKVKHIIISKFNVRRNCWSLYTYNKKWSETTGMQHGMVRDYRHVIGDAQRLNML